jgi:hypothetical protein
MASREDTLTEESNPITTPPAPSTSPSQTPQSPPPSLTTAQLDLLYGQTLSVIIPDELFLSDYQAPLDEKLLKLLGITQIVNASNGTVPNQFPELFEYFNVEVEDEDEADIMPYFSQVNDFIQSSITPNKKILFHCRLGISRSPALLMAYLMKTHRWTLRDSYDKTKAKRSKIQPGLQFCKALLDYEKVVFPELQENSITIQALCGGNQRYSIVSRQSVASIQRQSSIGESRGKSTTSLSNSHPIAEEGDGFAGAKVGCGCCVIL